MVQEVPTRRLRQTPQEAVKLREATLLRTLQQARMEPFHPLIRELLHLWAEQARVAMVDCPLAELAVFQGRAQAYSKALEKFETEQMEIK